MSLDLKIKLSTSSINEAIRQLKAYQQEISLKTSLFVHRLAEIGINTIDAHKHSRGDSDFENLDAYVEYDISVSKVRAKVILKGKDVAFIEFGAGVAYNGAGGTSPNPYGQPLGMVIGSYGKGHGLEDYWFYKNEADKWVMSKGTEAAMPMYYADREIVSQVINVAKEVFGNG